MKVLNDRSLQSEWERRVNGLHKALFIHAPTEPAPVPVRRRDIATGVCVCICICVWDVCILVVCASVWAGKGHPDTHVLGRSEQGAFRGYTQR